MADTTERWSHVNDTIPVDERLHRRRAEMKHTLLIEPDSAFSARLQQTAAPLVHLEALADFQTARHRLFEQPPDTLLTNLRLGAYNGLHLVYLTVSAALPTRSVVYSDRLDVALAHEAQRAGAFYESQARLQYALPAYLVAHLPVLDRRDPIVADRRLVFRGGRRRADVTGLRVTS